MLVELDDLIGITEAARVAGRAPVSMRQAAAKGRLHAKLIGTGDRATWVTTRDAVAEYLAYIAATAWANQPRRAPKVARKRRGTRRARRSAAL